MTKYDDYWQFKQYWKSLSPLQKKRLAICAETTYEILMQIAHKRLLSTEKAIELTEGIRRMRELYPSLPMACPTDVCSRPDQLKKYVCSRYRCTKLRQ